MTALPYPLCWHPAPTFSLQVLPFYFLFLVTFLSLCQIWAVLSRARGHRLCPRVRERSSRRRRSTASPGLRSLGSETAGRSPPAAACECSTASPRSVWGLVSRNALLLLQKHLSDQGVQDCGQIFFNLYPHTLCQSCTEVYEQILVQSPCSSAKLHSVIKQVIISPLLTLQAE